MSTHIHEIHNVMHNKVTSSIYSFLISCTFIWNGDVSRLGCVPTTFCETVSLAISA